MDCTQDVALLGFGTLVVLCTVMLIVLFVILYRLPTPEDQNRIAQAAIDAIMATAANAARSLIESQEEQSEINASVIAALRSQLEVSGNISERQREQSTIMSGLITVLSGQNDAISALVEAINGQRRDYKEEAKIAHAERQLVLAEMKRVMGVE